MFEKGHCLMPEFYNEFVFNDWCLCAAHLFPVCVSGSAGIWIWTTTQESLLGIVRSPGRNSSSHCSTPSHLWSLDGTGVSTARSQLWMREKADRPRTAAPESWRPATWGLWGGALEEELPGRRPQAEPSLETPQRHRLLRGGSSLSVLAADINLSLMSGVTMVSAYNSCKNEWNCCRFVAVRPVQTLNCF